MAGPRNPDDEARLAAIANVGRATRKRLPRWMWMAALAVTALCTIAVFVVLRADAPPPARHAAIRPCADAGSGLGIGLAFGAVGGAALGYVAGRVHSSRSRP